MTDSIQLYSCILKNIQTLHPYFWKSVVRLLLKSKLLQPLPNFTAIVWQEPATCLPGGQPKMYGRLIWIIIHHPMAEIPMCIQPSACPNKGSS